jgi:hypothetical protein
VFYEGRPSATQVERASAIERELGDVSHEFDRWIANDLAKLNAVLVSMNFKRIEPIVP